MAFAQANLSLVSYSGNGFHIWHYKSAGDDLNVIDAANYFNAMVNEMNVGDVIFIYAANGFGMCTVLTNNGTAIDTGDIVSMTSDSR
jgi:hypothetical protein